MDGKKKQQEYHQLTAQRIAQEKDRLNERVQELNQLVPSSYLIKYRLQSREKSKKTE